MTPFPKSPVSLRRAEGGRAVLEAECGFGLAIVPVDETRTRLAASLNQAGEGGDRQQRVRGFTLYHATTGMRLLPKGWFFTSIGAARACLAAIGAAYPSLFETRDINQFLPLAGPVMALARAHQVVAGKWSDIVRALDGHDEDQWTADAQARAQRMQALIDDGRNARHNREGV